MRAWRSRPSRRPQSSAFAMEARSFIKQPTAEHPSLALRSGGFAIGDNGGVGGVWHGVKRLV
jgi:hypothetical protein